MSDNGRPPMTVPLRRRVDPAKVAQLEQQSNLQATLLLARALSDGSNLANALHILIERADAGDVNARNVLGQLLANLDAARAAAAGIALPKRT